jgi:hypothetical protein
MMKSIRPSTGQDFQLLSYSPRMAVASALSAVVLAACGIMAASAETLSGEDARREASVTARSIKWETSLDAAEAKAKQNSKPILWVHMLGNVDGYT